MLKGQTKQVVSSWAVKPAVLWLNLWRPSSGIKTGKWTDRERDKQQIVIPSSSPDSVFCSVNALEDLFSAEVCEYEPDYFLISCGSFVFTYNKNVVSVDFNSLCFNFLLIFNHPITASICISGVSGTNCWSVIYNSSRRICALKGSSVNISSKYTHPEHHQQDKRWYKVKVNAEQEEELRLKTKWSFKTWRTNTSWD